MNEMNETTTPPEAKKDNAARYSLEKEISLISRRLNIIEEAIRRLKHPAPAPEDEPETWRARRRRQAAQSLAKQSAPHRAGSMDPTHGFQALQPTPTPLDSLIEKKESRRQAAQSLAKQSAPLEIVREAPAPLTHSGVGEGDSTLPQPPRLFSRIVGNEQSGLFCVYLKKPAELSTAEQRFLFSLRSTVAALGANFFRYQPTRHDRPELTFAAAVDFVNETLHSFQLGKAEFCVRVGILDGDDGEAAFEVYPDPQAPPHE